MLIGRIYCPSLYHTEYTLTYSIETLHTPFRWFGSLTDSATTSYQFSTTQWLSLIQGFSPCTELRDKFSTTQLNGEFILVNTQELSEAQVLCRDPVANPNTLMVTLQYRACFGSPLRFTQRSFIFPERLCCHVPDVFAYNSTKRGAHRTRKSKISHSQGSIIVQHTDGYIVDTINIRCSCPPINYQSSPCA